MPRQYLQPNYEYMCLCYKPLLIPKTTVQLPTAVNDIFEWFVLGVQLQYLVVPTHIRACRLFLMLNTLREFVGVCRETALKQLLFLQALMWGQDVQASPPLPHLPSSFFGLNAFWCDKLYRHLINAVNIWWPHQNKSAINLSLTTACAFPCWMRSRSSYLTERINRQAPQPRGLFLRGTLVTMTDRSLSCPPAPSAFWASRP